MGLPDVPASLFQAIKGYPGTVEVDAFDTQTLHALAKLGQVKTLTLNLHALDNDAFRSLMEACEFEELRIHLADDIEIDSQFLTHLSAAESVKKLHLVRETAPAITLTTTTLRQIKQLPIASLSCRFDSPESIDFSSFKNLEWFVIHDSPLNARVLSTIVHADMLSFENCKLDRESVRPLCGLRETELVLMNTEISPGAIEELTASDIPRLSIDNPELPIDLHAAMKLSNGQIENVALDAKNLNSVEGR